MSNAIGFYLLVAGFLLPWYVVQCYILRNDVSLLKKAFLSKDNSTEPLIRTIKKLKDEITQIKYIDQTCESKLTEVCNIWAKYRKFLMEEYPAEEGKDWEFTCEHHQKIEKILNDT